ncbi:MAG: hypothetical protein KGY99_05290 [Phycisphaerae bacterium]|nr:hypothetical protein [Phycisphaerae bacterium]
MQYGYCGTACSAVLLAMMVLGALLGCSGRAVEATLPSEADTEDDADKAPPKTTLTDGDVSLHIYLPHAERGHYRGVRFDWSGHVARAMWKGHTYFGAFRKADKPQHHDANAVGPAGEFGMGTPLGYEEATSGETFLKIGVGQLRKAADERYRFNKGYELVRPGAWTTEQDDGQITFRQAMRGDRGWAYAYTKRIALLDDQPGFSITYTLENTGSKVIDTTHYCHNFTIIDGVPIGPGYRVALPFEIAAEIKSDTVQVAGNTIVFRKPLHGSFFAQLTNFDDPADSGARIINERTGAGIEIQGDFTPVKYYLYAQSTAFCPEPYVAVKLAPGASKTWRTTYTLFETDTNEAQ